MLEEYIEILKKVKSLTTTVDGKEYIVTYQPFSETLEMVEPILTQYEIVRNNLDGVFVTRYP